MLQLTQLGQSPNFGSAQLLEIDDRGPSMSQYVFYTLDVFTDHIFGGNPLAVFPNGVGLETEQIPGNPHS